MAQQQASKSPVPTASQVQNEPPTPSYFGHDSFGALAASRMDNYV